MNRNIGANALKGSGGNHTINDTVDECPICKMKVQPLIRSNEINTTNKVVQVTYRCTNFECQELFIGTYQPESSNIYSLKKTAPQTPTKEIFPDSIVSISPSFESIYNQALAAEAFELDQVVGIGLRKALEFLIKDYSSYENPDEADTIRKIFLGKCINEYIDDKNIKACAKLATWLGNDETHYVRKWEDKDINDLKKLVKLTVNWIENTILTKDYIDEMNPAENGDN